MSKLLAIDGDILVYMIALSNERSFYCCNGHLYKTKGKAEHAQTQNGGEIYRYRRLCPEAQLQINLRSKMNSIFSDLNIRNYRLYITHPNIKKNFRYNLASIKVYKENRAHKPKPHFYQQVRNLLVRDYSAEIIEGEEADDAIGKLATEQYNLYNNYEMLYIASIDKDLRMIPGYHYNLKSRVLVYIDEQEASFNFWMQVVTGDRIDNIPGIYNWLVLQGKVDQAKELKKSRYLKKLKEELKDVDISQHEMKVRELYKKWHIPETVFNEVKELIKIRR